MANYTKTTNFAVKDSLSTGNPAKAVKGVEIDAEFENIKTAITSKADSANPTLTGTLTLGGVAITATGTELNYTDGVTSNIQTQLDAKQPLDAALTSISGLTTAADKMIYTTASDTYAVTDLSSFGRSLIDDANASTARTTLGVTAANILPSYAGNAGKSLVVNSGATDVEWTTLSSVGTVTSVNISGGTTGLTATGGPITSSGTFTLGGTLAIANGGTGTTSTTFVNLATNVTGTLPVGNGGTGITSLGTGVATFLGTPSSSNLAAAVTDETGSGALVFATSPTLVTPILGTPQSGVATNLTGLPLSTGVTGTLPVGNGGTGTTTLTLNNVILGNGTSAPLFVAPGTSGNVLTSNGTTWQSTTPAATGASKGQALAFALIFGL